MSATLIVRRSSAVAFFSFEPAAIQPLSQLTTGRRFALTGAAVPQRGEMFGMGQQRRPVIRNQHRPQFDQLFEVGPVEPTSL